MASFLRSTACYEIIRSRPLVAGFGLFTHFVLNKGEWEHSSHLIASGWILSFIAATTYEWAFDPQVRSIFQALQVSGTAAAVYIGALLTSLLIYRAFFHRLKKFPGPLASRLTKINSLTYVFPNYQYYKSIEKLHKEYKSDYVRTGPRELSIASADAVSAIHGPMTRCRKGAWYDGAKHIEGSSTHTTRDKEDHKMRRKDWDRAFSAKSLKAYEPRVNRHSYALIERLKEHAHEPNLRISNWLNFYGFDVMGDIGFSRSFDMLEKGKEDRLIELLHRSMAPTSVITHMTWLMGIITRLAGVEDMLEFMAWTSQALRERKKITPKENDIMSWIMDPNDADIPLHLNADARLLVVAGSDTTSATLTWLFYELCKNPDAQIKLRRIIDKICPEKAFLDAEDLANCPHLDGAINEALRLHPAVPSGVQRETPAEGIILPDQTFIPGETLIWMPIHTMQRDARYWREPLAFLPERWTDEKASYILDKRAFMPFSLGAYNCVGQKLAVMEMRCVTANVIRSFKMEFAEGENGEACENQSRDCFTLNVGKLDVKLTPRKVGQA